MTAGLSWLPFDLVDDLGWTLLHFLWQGFVLALACRILLTAARSARVRCAAATLTLLAMAAAPFATFAVVQHHRSIAPPAAHAAWSAPVARALPVLASRMDWVVAIWLAGVVALSLRMIGGWYCADRMRRRGARALPASVLDRCQTLCRTMGVNRPVQFLQSALITAPVVIGWLRPVVLIPFAALAGLTPAQLDAVIMHELAHIRRLDVLANLLQTVVETALFYHPAVWWVSRQIRIERENCCDDIAVARSGDVLGYAKALAAIAERRSQPAQAMAANGGMLMDRIARLLGVETRSRDASGVALWVMGLVCLAVGVIACCAAAIPPLSSSAPDTGLWTQMIAALGRPLQLEFDFMIIVNVLTIVGYILTEGVSTVASFTRASGSARTIPPHADLRFA